MQDTSANPYTVRLNSARLVNAYMGDLRLAGSRRNTQEDRGEERTYKVTINTAGPLLNFVEGVQSVGHQTAKIINNEISDTVTLKKMEETANGVKEHLKVLSDLQKHAESLKKDQENERRSGINKRQTTPQDGGFAERYGFAFGNAVAKVWSQKMEEVRNALSGRAECTGLRLDTHGQRIIKNN